MLVRLEKRCSYPRLNSFAPVWSTVTPAGFVIPGPSISFALEYEPLIEPGPTGTANATPCCLALTSPVPKQPVPRGAPPPKGCTPHLYVMLSYAKPTPATPTFTHTLTRQPLS